MTTTASTEAGPRYKNECPHCVWLGRSGRFDLYWCTSEDTHVAFKRGTQHEGMGAIQDLCQFRAREMGLIPSPASPAAGPVTREEFDDLKQRVVALEFAEDFGNAEARSAAKGAASQPSPAPAETAEPFDAVQYWREWLTNEQDKRTTEEVLRDLAAAAVAHSRRKS